MFGVKKEKGGALEMKKYISFFAKMVLMFALMILVGNANTVLAEETTEADTEKTYTVTFRAGNVGNIDTSKIDSEAGNVEVTANYVKYTVSKGSKLGNIFGNGTTTLNESEINAFFRNIVSVDEGYSLRNITELEEGMPEKEIRRNTEYVLDYVKLVDPVTYVVEFVDDATGEQIALPTIAAGNAGEEILCVPLSIAGYACDQGEVKLILTKDADNKVQFVYTYVGEVETVTETVVVNVPGDVITETVVNEISVANPQEQGAVNAPEGGATNGNADVNEENQGQDDNGEVEIVDEDVPLDDGADTLQIEDDEVPLASGEKELTDEDVPLSAGARMNPAVVGVVAAAIVATGGVAVFVFKRRKKNNVTKK